MPRTIPVPRLPRHETPDELPHDELEDYETYSQLNLVGRRLNHASGVSLKELRLLQGDLNGLQFRRLDLTDVLLQACDLSNSDWPEASGKRVRLAECRLTGVKWNGLRLQEAVFHNCQGKYAQFEGVRFKAVRFENCALIEANFDGADLSGVVFQGCDLLGATFKGARLLGTDFRGSKLERSRVQLHELRGAIVSPAQAVALLERDTGIVIAPED